MAKYRINERQVGKHRRIDNRRMRRQQRKAGRASWRQFRKVELALLTIYVIVFLLVVAYVIIFEA